MNHKHNLLGKIFIVWKNQYFYKGFLFKSFPFKQIDISQDIKPTLEEISNFEMTLNKPQTNNTMDDSDDDGKVDEVLKLAKHQGGASIYAKGDKINLLKGDLTGLKGTVVAISENGLITFKPIGVPKITKPLEIDAQNVCKYFEPGDLVRVIEAKYKGETG